MLKSLCDLQLYIVSITDLCANTAATCKTLELHQTENSVNSSEKFCYNLKLSYNCLLKLYCVVADSSRFNLNLIKPNLYS